MSSRAFVFRGGMAALLAATAACSWTVGFDGFAGSGAAERGDSGGDASPASDEAGGGSPADGSSGSDAADAGSSSTVDADAAAPVAAPIFVDGGSFCGTQDVATFCEDFDTEDLPVRWIKEGVFAQLTSTAPKSAPNVFLLDVPESSAGGTFVSKITRTLDAPSTNLFLDFDFIPEKVNLGSSFLILASLEYTKADAKYSIRLVYSSGSVRVEESNLVAPPDNKDEYHPFFTIPLGKWTRVKLDVVASGASPGVTVSLDGVAVGVRETLTPTPGIDPTPTLILGAVYAGSPHTGWTLRYDDVTVTYR